MKSGMCLASRAFSLDACFISGVLFTCASVLHPVVWVRVAELAQADRVIFPRPLHGPDCSQAPTSLMMCCLKPVISAAFRFHIDFLKTICSTVCTTSWIVLILNLPEPENPAGFVVYREKVSEVFVPFTHFQKSVSAGKRPVWLRTQRWTNWA